MTDGSTINDDEFEALLDELHGAGNVPGAGSRTEPRFSPSRIPTALTIREAGPLCEQLLARLADCASPIRMDLSGVETIDTSGIQMLMAFQRSVERTGSVCEWADPSEAVSRIVELLGVTSLRFSQAGHS